MSIESQVRDFYNENFKRFDSSRFSVWKAVKKFVDDIPENSNILDAGCGNGKNMVYMNSKNINCIGIDFSQQLLQICREKSLNVLESDIRKLPFVDNEFDFVISIAVVHHISSHEDRIKSINEMLRVCKSGGKVLISVWALEQDKDSRFNFNLGDNLVKWEDTTRYYHIFNHVTIRNLFHSFNIENIFCEMGNWFVTIKKS